MIIDPKTPTQLEYWSYIKISLCGDNPLSLLYKSCKYSLGFDCCIKRKGPQKVEGFSFTF